MEEAFLRLGPFYLDISWYDTWLPNTFYAADDEVLYIGGSDFKSEFDLRRSHSHIGPWAQSSVDAESVESLICIGHIIYNLNCLPRESRVNYRLQWRSQ